MIRKVFKGLGVLVALVAVLAGGVVGYSFYRFNSQSAAMYPVVDLGISQDVAKANVQVGKKIFVERNGCVHCHGADGTGRVVIDSAPFAVVQGANITPTGLKDWSDDQIARAIRFGVNREGQSLRFMPSYEFQFLAREDLASVIAYVRTLTPVDRPTQRPQIGPVAKVISTVSEMPVLFPAKSAKFTADFVAKPAEASTREFGHYLVHSACVGCHGPDLKGGPIPGGDPSWPPAANLRFAASAGTWTEESFLATMKTGRSGRTQQILREPMIALVAHPMGDTELTAVWKYLSELK